MTTADGYALLHEDGGREVQRPYTNISPTKAVKKNNMMIHTTLRSGSMFYRHKDVTRTFLPPSSSRRCINHYLSDDQDRDNHICVINGDRYISGSVLIRIITQSRSPHKLQVLNGLGQNLTLSEAINSLIPNTNDVRVNSTTTFHEYKANASLQNDMKREKDNLLSDYSSAPLDDFLTGSTFHASDDEINIVECFWIYGPHEVLSKNVLEEPTLV